MSDENNRRHLPADGTIVTARTFASIEYDEEPQLTTGILSTRDSPFGGIPQCWVDSIPVQPETVKPLQAEPKPEDAA